MRRRICTHITTYILIAISIISLAFPCDIAKASGSVTMVTVAYIDDGPLIHYNESTSSYTGYAVDYLNAISPYCKWAFRYVKTSWSDALKGVDSGTIDLILGAEKTDEREITFCYSESPLIQTKALLYTLPDRDICYEEYDSFNGCNIGFIEGSEQINEFKIYAKAHNFTYHPIIYKTAANLTDALNKGIVDLITDDSLHPLRKYKLVGTYGNSLSYIVASKDNTKLMQTLNNSVNLH